MFRSLEEEVKEIKYVLAKLGLEYENIEKVKTLLSHEDNLIISNINLSEKEFKSINIDEELKAIKIKIENYFLYSISLILKNTKVLLKIQTIVPEENENTFEKKLEKNLKIVSSDLLN